MVCAPSIRRGKRARSPQPGLDLCQFAASARWPARSLVASGLSQERRLFLSKPLHANRSPSHANQVSGRASPAAREAVFGRQRQKAANWL